jgi:four helix bundle protein
MMDAITLKNTTIHGINNAMDRKHINSGFKTRRAWQDAVSLYVMACQIFGNFPFELKKVVANSIDAAHSIPRNISQGYCRRSLKEYQTHLNIALGSGGEPIFQYSSMPTFHVSRTRPECEKQSYFQ